MRCTAILAGLLICAALLHAGDGSESSPLTGEDVVRMHLQGKSAEELSELIASSHVAFDIADDMLDELSLAGVPRAVIDTMVKRQRQLDAALAPEETPAEQAAPSGSELRLRINPESKDGPGSVRLDDLIDPPIAEQFRMRGEDDFRITDLALAVVCLTADHVPDHWRSQSPLGRDFVTMSRHRVLFFQPGAEFEDRGKLGHKVEQLQRSPGHRDAVKPSRWVTLNLPEGIAVPLEQNVVHDLALVVAMEINGDRYYGAASSRLPGVILLGDGDLPLEATINSGKSGSLGKLEVELTLPGGVATGL